MSITIDRPTTASRILRRHTIITTQGMDGVLAVTAELRACATLVKEMAVDVREGVGCSALTCSVSMTAEEAADFAAHLRTLPAVESVDPY
ncbi:hypothetical protein [Pseudonocardia xishanensis]|uniref:Uncharacterized protein n=1 Tax=Pseudonocardia xishanensis TaxID=630995 RepID=A0ABP8RS18_9PSEU